MDWQYIGIDIDPPYAKRVLVLDIKGVEHIGMRVQWDGKPVWIDDRSYPIRDPKCWCYVVAPDETR